MKFDSLSLCEPLLRSLRAAKYTTATPIQQQAIPPVLEGRDLVACAQTGTGKTAAFSLPMLQRLMETEIQSEETRQRGGRKGRGPRRPIRALILAPTRELAGQIGESLSTYGGNTTMQHAVIYGGVSQRPQVRAIQRGVDILVATPGRLLDLVGQGYIKLGSVEVLVLDEADHMLDMGFIHDLRKIVDLVPRKRQTLLFSATMPPEIRRLAEQWLRDPAEVHVAPVASTPELVSQVVHFVEPHHKVGTLTQLLRTTSRGKTLVFSRTKRGADRIAHNLERDGIAAVAIHGNKSQAKREAIIRQFNSKRPPVLVATDLAARGLDFSQVSHVINYDLPDVPETYVHRIGRTARAGNSGQAISFCGRDERKLLRMIEKLTGQRVPIEDAPAVTGERRKPAPAKAEDRRERSQGENCRPKRGGHAGGARGKARPGRKPTSKPRPGKPYGQAKPATNGETAEDKPVATRRRKFSKSGRGRRYSKARVAGAR